jgi:glutamine cyclotransferase
MKRRIKGALVLAIVLLVSAMFFVSTIKNEPKSSASTKLYTYTVVSTYPHDTNAFTEGLLYSNGELFESTGLYGKSALRRVDLETGNVLKQVTLQNQFFGEGIAIVNSAIIQLTYREHIGFVYDKATFALLSNFTVSTESWGITFDGNRLIMSDGTNKLYFLDPETYQSTGYVEVHDGNASITELNELEFINCAVYANVWRQQKVAVINPGNGEVEAWIDLSGLINSTSLGIEEVLNGIAYNPKNDTLLVTGKNWPQLFEIKLILSK